jgi:hypothetical protein
MGPVQPKTSFAASGAIVKHQAGTRPRRRRISAGRLLSESDRRVYNVGGGPHFGSGLTLDTEAELYAKKHDSALGVVGAGAHRCGAGVLPKAAWLRSDRCRDIAACSLPILAGEHRLVATAGRTGAAGSGDADTVERALLESAATGPRWRWTDGSGSFHVRFRGVAGAGDCPLPAPGNPPACAPGKAWSDSGGQPSGLGAFFAVATSESIVSGMSADLEPDIPRLLLASATRG